MIKEILLASTLTFNLTPLRANDTQVISYGNNRYTESFAQVVLNNTTYTRFFDIDIDWEIDRINENNSLLFVTTNIYISSNYLNTTTSLTWEQIDSIDSTIEIDLPVSQIYSIQSEITSTKVGNYLSYDIYYFVNDGDYDSMQSFQNLVNLQRYFPTTANMKYIKLSNSQNFYIYETGFGKMYDIGWETRMESVEDTEQRMNSIWSIIERSVEAVLNVLSLDILPGIPLYICIAVPVLFALLIWFIKMGAS